VLDTAEWLEGRGVEVVRLPVGPTAWSILDISEMRDRRRARALVAVMLVNNEIGVIQPIAEIARWRTRPRAR
jgi:cysteine desulfurase